jgi:ADP-heptose:LPS heptosyltransferase
MDILIISTNALGDTYLSAAAIAPLRAYFNGQCKIHLLVLDNTVNSRLLAEGLDVDVIRYLDSKSPMSILKSYVNLRKVRYDYVFSFFPGRANTFFLMMARAKVRIGYPNLKNVVQWYRGSQKVYSSVDKGRKYIWQPNMTYMERIGLCLSAAKITYGTLCKPKLSNVRITEHIPSDFILVHLTSSTKDRTLNFDAQCALVSFLFVMFDCRIIVLGWRNEVLSLKRHFIRNDMIHFVQDAPMQTLAEHITMAKNFIAIDSFPLHIADVYKTKYIGIFGPTQPDLVFESCSQSITFSCTDLSAVDGQSIINAIIPLLAR